MGLFLQGRCRSLLTGRAARSEAVRALFMQTAATAAVGADPHNTNGVYD